MKVRDFLLVAWAVILGLGLLFLATGCVTDGTNQGGSAAIYRTGPKSAEVKQGENAKQPSLQDVESENDREITLPAGSVIDDYDGTNIVRRITLSAPAKMIIHSKDKSSTRLGASQKNMFQETAAKLASLRWITWVGGAVFLFGIASAFWPPLKALVMSTTTSAALAAAGLAMMVLPVLVVGHELLIMSVALALAGAWWFAHRHGHLRGQLTALLAKV